MRFSTALLTLALALPSPVFALRAGLEGTTEHKVQAALTTSATQPTAGLEEGVVAYQALNEAVRRLEPGLQALHEAGQIPEGAEGRPVIAMPWQAGTLPWFYDIQTEAGAAKVGTLQEEARQIPGLDGATIQPLPAQGPWPPIAMLFADNDEVLRGALGSQITVVDVRQVNTFRDALGQLFQPRGLPSAGPIALLVYKDRAYIFA